MNSKVVLAAILASVGSVSAAPGEFTIQALPQSAARDLPVCYDLSSGTLGNCPGSSSIHHIAVDCSSESIMDALDEVPAFGWVQLDISGTCTENVTLSRNQTILQGGVGASIEGQTAGQGAITVTGGANNVAVNSLGIENGAGHGLVVLHGASVLAQGLTVQNNAGIGIKVGLGSNMYIAGGTQVTGAGDAAVLVHDSSHLVVDGGGNVFNSNIGGKDGTITVYRTSSAKIMDTLNINNTGGGRALYVAHGSSMRQDNGFATIEGDLGSYNLSSLMIRDASITGDAKLSFRSTMRFRDEDGAADGTSKLTGKIDIKGGGSADFKSSFHMQGDIECIGSGSKVGSPTFDSGTFVNC